jgi:hypothetical protein
VTYTRRWIWIALVLGVTACSAPQDTPAAAPSSSAPSASASPSASAFCLDLTVFQLGALLYRDDVVKAARGARDFDVAMAQYRAATVARLAAEMQSTVPPDIADPFRRVVDAVAASAANLKPGVALGQVAAPLVSADVVAAFLLVNECRC